MTSLKICSLVFVASRANEVFWWRVMERCLALFLLALAPVRGFLPEGRSSLLTPWRPCGCARPGIVGPSQASAWTAFQV